MPFILGVDCALRRVNLGAFGENIRANFSLDAGMRQSELLPGAVAGFLASIGKSLEEVELIAATNGPGYYTGIRVGLSYASALAYSLWVKIVPISTLEAIA